MAYDNCQFSNVTWFDKNSTQFKALMAGLKGPDGTKSAAVATFIDNLVSAHRSFKSGLRPGADLITLLKVYQANTGIISTRGFTFPGSPPGGPGDPDTSFFTDLVEDIAGAAVSEIGYGISVYTLILDLIHLFDIKLHVNGVLMNTSSSDLTNVQFEFLGGRPNMLPLSASIPAAKSVMDPLNKTNHDCVGFTLFGAIGDQAMQGFRFDILGEKKADEHRSPDDVGVTFQYYEAGERGFRSARVHDDDAGGDDPHHDPRDFQAVYLDQASNTLCVLVDKLDNQNYNAAALFCTQ